MQIPNEIESALDSDEFFEATSDVGTKYGLDLDGVGYLQTVTAQVLSGAVPRNNFSQALQLEAEIPADLAQKVTQEVDELVVAPLASFIPTSKPQSSPNVEATNTVPSNPSNLPELPEEHRVMIRKVDTQEEQGSRPAVPVSQIAPAPQNIPTAPVSQPEAPKQPEGPKQGQGIVATRLNTSINLPHEEVRLDQETKPAQPKPAPYSGNDPYREPIE